MPQKKLSPPVDPIALDTYRNAIASDIDPNSGVPPTAPAFRPYPDVRGDTAFANIVDELLKRVPELRGRASVITHGPDQGTILAMIAAGLPPDEFERTNLLGLTNKLGGDRIAINPRQSGEFATSTLAHEFAHSRGYREDDARSLAAHVKKALGLSEFDSDYEREVTGFQALVDAMKKMPRTKVRVSTDEKDKY